LRRGARARETHRSGPAAGPRAVKDLTTADLRTFLRDVTAGKHVSVETDKGTCLALAFRAPSRAGAL
jgi:hypothetical protein